MSELDPATFALASPRRDPPSPAFSPQPGTLES
jgi:hypothetical protein